MAELNTSSRTLTGRIVSDKMDKTITVLVERRVKHPVYGKILTKSSKIKAHDEGNDASAGDLVSLANRDRAIFTSDRNSSAGSGASCTGTVPPPPPSPNASFAGARNSAFVTAGGTRRCCAELPGELVLTTFPKRAALEATILRKRSLQRAASYPNAPDARSQDAPPNSSTKAQSTASSPSFHVDVALGEGTAGSGERATPSAL